MRLPEGPPLLQAPARLHSHAPSFAEEPWQIATISFQSAEIHRHSGQNYPPMLNGLRQGLKCLPQVHLPGARIPVAYRKIGKKLCGIDRATEASKPGIWIPAPAGWSLDQPLDRHRRATEQRLTVLRGHPESPRTGKEASLATLN